MKWQAIALLGTGLALGVCLVLWKPLDKANSQTNQKPSWEHKVVRFNRAGDYGVDRDGKKTEAMINKQYNDLMADGWEYVGMVYSPGGYSDGYVAFKRPKR